MLLKIHETVPQADNVTLSCDKRSVAVKLEGGGGGQVTSAAPAGAFIKLCNCPQCRTWVLFS